MESVEGNGHPMGHMEPLGFLRDRAASSCTAAEAEGRNGTVHTPGGTEVPSLPQLRRERSRTDDAYADGSANDDGNSAIAWPRPGRAHADAEAGAADWADAERTDPRRGEGNAAGTGSGAAPEDAPAVEGAVSLFGNGKAEHIGKEDDEGNVEYKRTLARPSPERILHLTTQLKFRLGEGANEATYMIGWDDDGSPVGLCEEDLTASIDTLTAMARSLEADTSVIALRDVDGSSPGLRTAEVLVRRNYSTTGMREIRVAMCGNVDSGKSTLIGVLTRGGLDDGRGSARMLVFRHKHEVENGRTSSVSQQIMGFRADGAVTNYASVRSRTDREIMAESDKVITFVDLAGHERYLKTTVFGLTGQLPDYASLVLGANMGVQRMTKEHLGIALALKLPVFVVVTKVDIAPEHVRKRTVKTLTRILKGPAVDRMPFVVRSAGDVVTAAKSFATGRLVPIFLTSNVTGGGLDFLRTFLSLLPRNTAWERHVTQQVEFHIDDSFSVTGVGTVVAGTMYSGTVNLGGTLLLGPDPTGGFQPVHVKGIHTKRLPVQSVCAGQSASFAIKAAHGPKLKRASVRKGMVLVGAHSEPQSARFFEAEVLVLHHPTTIQVNYQPMVHARAVRQSARILRMTDPLLRTGDRALCLFRLMYRPEFLTPGTPLLFREGRTKGVGRITRVLYGGEEESTVPVTPMPRAAAADAPAAEAANGATAPPAGNGAATATGAASGSASGGAKPARRRAGHAAAPATAKATATATGAAHGTKGANAPPARKRNKS